MWLCQYFRFLIICPEMTARLITKLFLCQKSKTECDSVKHKLCALEEDFTKKTVIQKTEMVQLSMDLHAAIKVSLVFRKLGLMHVQSAQANQGGHFPPKLDFW